MGSLSVSLQFQSAAYGFLIAMVVYGSISWLWLIVSLPLLIDVPSRLQYGFSWGDRSGFSWIKRRKDTDG